MNKIHKTVLFFKGWLPLHGQINELINYGKIDYEHVDDRYMEKEDGSSKHPIQYGEDAK